MTTTDEEAWPNCPVCDEEMRPGGDPTPGTPYINEAGVAEVPLEFGFVCENKNCPSNDSDLAPAAEHQSAPTSGPTDSPRLQQADEATDPRDG